MTEALRRIWAKDLDAQTLYELLKLRVEVFVVEQAIPYPELDGRDLLAETRHFWLETSDGEVICTLRLMEEHAGGEKAVPDRAAVHQTQRARTGPHHPAAARRTGRGGRLPVPDQRADLSGGHVRPARFRPRRRRFPRRRRSARAHAAARLRPGGQAVKPYPFSAIVGHDQLRLALLLCAVRPEIGGALIRGEKGTAKSTAVRGLAALLSAATGSSVRGGLVEMPLGATEDRVIGSLDLQRVLRDGEHAFSPGLLARAHGGVLYVDEVNLLHDHLVDVLLDAAAMGRVHVERDGISAFA